MIVLLLIIATVESKFETNGVKKDFCETLSCEDADPICGIREEGKGFRLRLFESECELLKYGCKVEPKLAYGLTNMEDCEQGFQNISEPLRATDTQPIHEEPPNQCTEFDCSYPSDAVEICAVRKDGKGYRIRLFENICKLWMYNCENQIKFTQSEIHICYGLRNESETQKFQPNKAKTKKVMKNVVIVDSSMINFNDFNESIENFFAATHVFDLPLQDIHQSLNETGRRRLVNVFGPQKIFKPWISIPQNISEDFYHLPTLSSCYHKCPTVRDSVVVLIYFGGTCPDTYAPVCGVPGIVAREPSLMFQNHCFMDVAQCKMFWEDKSDTAASSNYIESSFLFCLGDEMNGLFRFLPLIRTLQHMGRLKKKGHFNYKIKNMRFFNNLLSREPHIMDYIESSFLFCLGDEMNGLFRFLPLIRTLQHMGRLKKKGHFNYKIKNMRFFNNLLSREPHIMG